MIGNAHAFILTDENVENSCLPLIIDSSQKLQESEIVTIPAGETSKCFDILDGILQTFLENAVDRQSILINIGGGVVCDIGGFAASIFKRGISHIQVPTSLMAMADAAIGGKNGINLSHVKNAVGTFYPSKAVLIYPPFLHSLPEEEVLSGMAEMLKHALIADRLYWDQLTSSDLESLIPLIQRSSRIKEKIVATDLEEKSSRKLLNFGHSIGHAIESLYLVKELSISHGHAVAIGMLVESALSVQKVQLPKESFIEIANRLRQLYNIPTLSKEDFEIMLEFLHNDKKNEEGEFRFSLIEEIGKGCFNISVSEAEVEEALMFTIS